MPASDVEKKVVKGGTLLLASSLVSTLIGYALRIFFARQLSVEEFGLLYSILSLLAFVSMFRELGLNQALIRFIPEFLVKQKDSVKPAVVFALVSQLAVMFSVLVVIWFFSGQIAAGLYSGFPASSAVIMILAASIFFSIFFVLFQTVFQSFQRMVLFSLIEPVRIITVSLLSVSLIYMGVVGIAWAYLLAAVVMSLLFFPLFMKTISGKWSGSLLSRPVSSRMLSFSVPIIIGGISSIFVLFVDTMVITVFRTIGEVGLYQAALPTSQILWVASTSVAAVIFPVISHLYAMKKKAEASGLVSFVIVGVFFFVMPLSMVMFSLSDIILFMLFGYGYVLAADALRILAIGALVYSLFFILQTVIYSIGKSVQNTKILITMALVAVFLDVVLIPFIGIIGAAITNVVSYSLGLFLSYRYLKKIMNINVRWSRIAKIFVGGLLASTIIMVVKYLIVTDIVALEIVISVIPGALFYLAYIVLTKSITRSDIFYLQSLGIGSRFLEFTKRYLRD